MASSISAPTPHNYLSFKNPHKFLHLPKRPFYPLPLPPFPDSITLCRSSSSSSDNNNNSNNRPWDLAAIPDALKNAVKKFDSYMKDASSSDNHDNKKKDAGKNTNDGVFTNESGEDDWDWDRWKKHFDQVDEQERLVSNLKSQLGNAVYREEYGNAARLKVAIAAAASNGTVGRVVSHLNSALVEERYEDAALLRDKSGAGLVGWWTGISEDKNDPYGLIICVTAEHGKYVARSYSPRQLATAAAGNPLFEIFLTVNKRGEYKQQAVYLKRRESI